MSTPAASANADTVRAHWGAQAPEWIVVLASACDLTSQGRVAKALVISSAVVNQALQNKYPGRMDRLEQRVRGEYMHATVACPVLGDLSTRRCLDEQARPFANTNPQRVALFKACQSCEHRKEATCSKE